jgi:hypothetical protein
VSFATPDAAIPSQVTPIDELIVTAQAIPVLSIEPTTSIHQFGELTAAEIAFDQAGQAESRNFPAEIAAFAARPSVLAQFGQSLARSGKKIEPYAIIAAGFTPIGDILDAALIAEVVPSSRALGRALELSGIERPAGAAAHHIAAGSAQGAAEARAVLRKFGIGINDSANGVFLAGAQHAGVHTAEYYAAVNRALATATSRAQAEQILESLGIGLKNGTFP